jgi:GH24 family phage-related lysozyme (muramidase)
MNYNDFKRKRDQKLADMVAHFEGEHQNAYLDSELIPTIGIGATTYEDGSPVELGDNITKQKVDELFKFHLDRATEKVRNDPGFQKLPPNAQSAIKSFAFNAGPNFMERGDDFATITRAIKAGDAQAVAAALPLYDNGGLPGLVRRREAEARLALRPAMDPIDSTLANDRTRAFGTPAVLKGKTVKWGGPEYGWQSPESFDLITPPVNNPTNNESNKFFAMFN